MSIVSDYAAEKTELEQAGRLRVLREIEPLDGGKCRMNGKTYWNFSGNDYMGISGDRELRREFYARFDGDFASPELAQSSASSRLLTGNTPACVRLERTLAEMYGHGRDAIVFNSGYHANIGILPALAASGDLILADKLDHASIIDGLRLGDAEFRRFPHLDCDSLERILAQKRAAYKRVFIVTESVFSMDGDAADLKRLAELRDRYDCVLVVDEAHSVGLRGPKGLGMSAELGLTDQVDVLIGTFGKAFGSTGAYAILDPVLKTRLVNHMRSVIFTTALPPVVLNWSNFVLEKCARMDDRREHLAELGRRLRAKFEAAGCRSVPGNSQIVPYLVGADADAVARAEAFQRNGILVFAIRPPTVPRGTARLRFSLSAAMDFSAVDEMGAAL